MTKQILHFFDRLEDKIRGFLSHYPLLYALIAGVGVVLFWRGVWNTADIIDTRVVQFGEIPFEFDLFNILSGPVSVLIGSVILLITGVFVSEFIGGNLIISGIKGEKKMVEKTEDQIKEEGAELKHIENTLHKIQDEITEIKEEIKK